MLMRPEFICEAQSAYCEESLSSQVHIKHCNKEEDRIFIYLRNSVTKDSLKSHLLQVALHGAKLSIIIPRVLLFQHQQGSLLSQAGADSFPGTLQRGA